MRVSLYMAALLERFRDHVARLGLFPRPGAALVAVSGGPDSVALLDLMSAVAGVLAHHRDDQLETILMRVLRGSAPAGLAAMAPVNPGGLVRPLLPFSKAELARHAATRGLASHDDPANADPRHLRSWVRTTLLP